MIQECECVYCKLGISEEQRDEMAFDFICETLKLYILQATGVLDTPDNRQTFEIILPIFDRIVDDIDNVRENDQYIMNEFGLCFNTPFDFYHAITHMTDLLNAIRQALDRDTALAITPILSKIITPEIFLQYYLTKEFPQSVMDIVDKAQRAQEHPTMM